MAATSTRRRRTAGPSGRPAERCWPVACGVDVVELEQFERAVKRWGAVFLGRIFTQLERRYAEQHRHPLLHLAARFAAKEAVIKAVSQIAPRKMLTMKQIEIRNDRLGRPYVVLPARRALPAVHVSLSHAKRVVVASAIVIR